MELKPLNSGAIGSVAAQSLQSAMSPKELAGLALEIPPLIVSY
jgi:hypothetical protein